MSRFSSGDVQHAYSSSALRSLDQSPPRLQTMHQANNPFVTSKMMATSRFGRPAPLKPSSIKQPINASAGKADRSLNWRRVDFRSDVKFEKSSEPSMKQTIDDLIQETAQEARSIVESTLKAQSIISPSSLTRSGSQSGLTAALLSRRSSGTPALDQTINQAINATINETLSQTQPIDQSIIDTNQELLGRAGDSASNAAFIVRSKVNGQLSIFKPADGEMTLEQIKLKQTMHQSIKHANSPSFSSSEPATPLSPGSPEAALIPSDHSINHTLQTRTPLRKGVMYGETALKEAAAFLLDDGFSGVPETSVTTLMVPRDPSTLPVIDPTSIIATNTQKQLTNSRESARSSKQLNDRDGIAVPRSSAISIGQSIRESINQPLRESYDESINNQSINQSINQADYVPRFGSLSAFVPHLTSADEMGASFFSIDDVHKIGVLDIRLLNLDRHLGNILVSKETDPSVNQSIYKLHPIDHGYILPSYSQLSDVRFEWTNWRQTYAPFSEKTLEHIASLDPIRDCIKLQAIGLKFDSLIALVFSTLLLQRGAAAGLCLHDIAQMCQRSANNDDDSDYDSDDEDSQSEPSVLEVIVGKVLQNFSQANNQSNNQASEEQGPVIQLINSPTLQPTNQSSPVSDPVFSPLSGESVDMQRSRSSMEPSSIKSLDHSISQPVTCFKPIQSVPFDSTTVRLLLSTMSDAIDGEIARVQRGQEASRSLMR